MRAEQSGYIYYLGYAVFFCLEQNWLVASILARRALDIAVNKKPLNVTGREAAYLEAVALLRLRQQMQHLYPDREGLLRWEDDTGT